MLRSNLRPFVALLLYLSIAAAIAWSTVAHLDVSRETGPDVEQYVRIHEGVPLAEIPAPYRYRPLVPWMARLAPDPPARVMLRPDTARAKAVPFRFALVNLIGLGLAAWFVQRMMEEMGFGALEALLGGLLFLTTHHAIKVATLPLIDAWAYAFLAGCLLALLRSRRVWLLLLFGVGIFAKETIVLVLPAALLLRRPLVERVKLAGWCLPGLAAYVVFRWVLYPQAWPLYTVESARKYLTGTVFTPEVLPGVVARTLVAFGVLGALAAFGWIRLRHEGDHPLVRWSWLLWPIALAPFVLALNVDRVWFFAFPVFVPLAVVGLREVYRWGAFDGHGRRPG